MKEERYPKERISLIEKEMATLTEMLGQIGAAAEEIEELRRDIKRAKTFSWKNAS